MTLILYLFNYVLTLHLIGAFTDEKIPIVAFRSALTNTGEKMTDDEVDEVIRKVEHNDAEINLKKVQEIITTTSHKV
jgi:Ca2+-binding EF-hand superfamily protein